jgi:very-short-patch-repair endonuclease
MNEIEQKFYKAFIDGMPDENVLIEPGKVIGPYKADFLIEYYEASLIVEIDGHEYHKTEEQRDYDYKRERYFMKQGFIVVRFMGTEVFLEAEKCIEELEHIANCFSNKVLDALFKGIDFGERNRSNVKRANG